MQQVAMDFPADPARRLFIGLFPDAATQAAIVQARQRWSWVGRPSLPPPGRLHLTLAFLGDLLAPQEQQAREALAATRMQPLELVLRQPRLWRGGIAVLLPDAHPGLLALHARLATALQARGIAAGRPGAFTPHLTLARKAGAAQPPREQAPIAWRAGEMVLVWSRLPPAVPQASYAPLARQVARP